METVQQPDESTKRYPAAGLFTDRTNAEKAISELKAAGFHDDHIGVAWHDGSNPGGLQMEDGHPFSEDNAASRAVGGGLLGGFVGALLGMGALAIPGMGTVVAGGALASMVAGVGIGVTSTSGALAGGLLATLGGFGFADDDSRRLQQGFEEGRVLVVVECGLRLADALEILTRNGADVGPTRVISPGSYTESHGLDHLAQDELDDSVESSPPAISR